MILVDMSQVMLSNVMVGINTYAKDMEFNEDLVRHMILNSLRSYREKFGKQYGELILCYDSPNSWRKDVFPYYKANRKKSRSASAYDWNAIFTYLNQIKAELHDNFPYAFMQTEKAEADDIIATLVMHNVIPGKTLIVSGDKDFIQLQINRPDIHQYSPVQKIMIDHEDPVAYWQEHIIRGDSGDGIPNILSEDDAFVSGKRQKQIRQKFVDETFASPAVFYGLKNYDRNNQLISLHPSIIPQYIQSSILNAYIMEQDRSVDRSMLLPYFIEKKLMNLMDVIDEF